jgi:Zn-dependent peptidase ImmA (M78 family)
MAGDRLARVAETLGYPVEFFTTEPSQSPAPTACAFPRKRNSLPTSAEKRARALLEVTSMQVEALLDQAVPAVTVPRRAPRDEGWISPAEMAGEVRRLAGFASGPISDLVGLLERLGVIVVVLNLGNRRLDALGHWPDGHRPLMLVNSTAPADRRRFTMAHELGHAVLHFAPSENQEAEADQFAAELLMPAQDGHRALHDIDLPKLARLKAAWGMSMASLLHRAYDLGRVSDYRYRQLNVELSAAGYRTKEPVALEHEKPGLLPEIIDRCRASGESIEQLASRARMTKQEFQALYVEVPT